MCFIGRTGDESTSTGLGDATVGSSKPGWQCMNDHGSSYD